MKKIGGSLLALNLILSLLAFCFILQLISAENGAKIPDTDDSELVLNEKGEYVSSTKQSVNAVRESIRTEASIATLPVKPTSSSAFKGFSIGSKTYTKFEVIDGEVKGYLKGFEISNTLVESERLEMLEKGYLVNDNGNFKLISPETGSDAGNFLATRGFSLGASNFYGHIASGLVWSITVMGVIKMFGGMFDEEGAFTNALSVASFGGIMAGKTAYGLIKEGGWLGKTDFAKWANTKIPMGVEGVSIGAGIFVGAIIFYNSYKSTSTEVVSFTCETWDAPTGGANCEKCNQQGELPCSEYQCRSLGQSCELVNPGTTESKCVWVNKNDVTFPIIKTWEDVLSDGYSYSLDNTISPPDAGVKILKDSSTTGCVKAFEPLSFGITTNEPAKCKIDYLRKENFEDMDYYFGSSSTHKYNHSQLMALPGGNTSAGNTTVVLQNNGNYELYVRCQDKNGNYNKGNFVFKYCVEQGPDTTPVLIVTTNLLNNMPIAYNQTEVDLEVYVNEPAECKWSHIDQVYDDMEEKMSCAISVFEMNAQMLYKCTTELTGLKNSVDNKFYFRCKDQPGKPENERNTNAESYDFTLIGTQPLVLSSIGPNGTIKDSTESVKVTLTARTDAGYKEGKATCYYSDDGNENNYIMFFETESYEHSQDLYLTNGDYEYWIKCVDLGGNSAINKTEFSVETDLLAPLVVRTYHEESYLKLVTNENAECVYDIVNCNYLFDDGTKISTVDDTGHFIDWNTKISLYVKCKDEFGNQPAPSECNMVVRAIGI